MTAEESAAGMIGVGVGAVIGLEMAGAVVRAADRMPRRRVTRRRRKVRRRMVRRRIGYLR